MAQIVVIGAGMGAMAGAARLAVAGHRVTVFERGESYGGSVRQVERDGFRFDAGPGLLPLPAVYRDLFVKTGKQPLEECVDLVQVDPAVRHLFADGTVVDVPNASRAGTVEAVEAALGGGNGERWAQFLNRAREAWDRSRRPLLEEPLWADWRVLGERDPYPAVRGAGLLRRRPPTFAEAMRYELADPRLIALVESSVLGYGLDPRAVPASAAVLPYMEQAFGTWYVRGGIRELARAVYERCVQRRVRFEFGAEVVRVVEKDGRAAGVELADGSVHEAAHVVAGVGDAGRLTGRALQTPGEDAVLDTGRARPGRCTVMLALRGAREGDAVHRTVVHTSDRKAELDALGGGSASGFGPTVTVLRPDDPALVPDPRQEHEAVVLSAVVRPGGGAAEGPEAEGFADRMVDAAERAVPGLRERMLWREVRMSGPVPHPALAGADGRFLYPSNTTRLPGLHLVGGWAHPGGGLPHAGMSGALVAGLIVEGPDFRGSQ